MRGMITPHIKFLAACSYLPHTEEGFLRQRVLLERACATPLDPKILRNGIIRHRIFALADEVLRRHSMTGMLGEFQPALEARAKKARLQSLRLAAESQRVSGILSDAGIEHRFIKGPLLSKKIYGDPGLRHSKDLDLLVEPGNVSCALRLLQEEGWEGIRHNGMWLRSGPYRWIAQRWLRHFGLIQRKKNLNLELHWRVEASHDKKMDRAWWTNWEDFDSCVGRAEFLHLCLHGAVHAWIRLKWIGDLQAILERNPDLWTESRTQMGDLGLELIAAQAILLQQALFDTQLDGDAKRIVERQPAALELSNFALEKLQLESVRIDDSVSKAGAARRYLWKLNQRQSRPARILDFLGFCFVDPEDLEGWDTHAALLPAISLMRASKVVRRYCFGR